MQDQKIQQKNIDETAEKAVEDIEKTDFYKHNQTQQHKQQQKKRVSI